MSRQLLVKNAQSWYDAALGINTGGEIYSANDKLFCMENALNHTENKLAAALEVLRGVLIWEVQDDDNELDYELKKKIEKLVEE
jgi:hypothetical protein